MISVPVASLSQDPDNPPRGYQGGEGGDDPDLAGRRVKPRAVADLLRKEIQDGTLAPGEWLREIPIAKRLGAGRTAVRDALRQLELDGLVEVAKFRGARVTAPTLYQMFDLFEVRAALFGLVARFVCFRADDASLAEIVGRIDRLIAEAPGMAASQRVDDGVEIGALMLRHANPEAQQMMAASARRARWHFSYAGLQELEARRGVGPIQEWTRLRAALAARQAEAAAEAARSIIYFTQGEVTKLLIARGGDPAQGGGQ
jgi:DNA-binding GntR family transcriptional regulator